MPTRTAPLGQVEQLVSRTPVDVKAIAKEAGLSKGSRVQDFVRDVDALIKRTEHKANAECEQIMRDYYAAPWYRRLLICPSELGRDIWKIRIRQAEDVQYYQNCQFTATWFGTVDGESLDDVTNYVTRQKLTRYNNGINGNDERL